MAVDIQEYFRYHPPKTPDRIQKHDNVNRAALEFATDPGLFPWYQTIIQENVADENCQKFALAAAEFAVLMSEADRNLISDEEIIKLFWQKIEGFSASELFFFWVQISRMLANQGITIDELKTIKSTL